MLLIHRSFAGRKENLHDDKLPEGRCRFSAISAPLPSPFPSECLGTDMERDPGIPLQM